jgi:hypothetical protein
MNRRGAVHLSAGFYTHPQVLRASDLDPGSVGLFIRSLHKIAEVSPWIEEPCVPTFYVDGWIAEAGLRPRRPITALLRAGLWERLRENSTGRVVAYIPRGCGDFWQFGALREPIPLSRRQAVIQRDQRVCGLCHRRVSETETLHIDHIKPVALGGRSNIENLQVAHARCNLLKGARGG